MKRLLLAAMLILTSVNLHMWCRMSELAKGVEKSEVYRTMARDCMIAMSYRIKKLEDPKFELYGQPWPFTEEAFSAWLKQQRPE